MRLREMVSTIKNTQHQEQGNYTVKFNEAHHKACEKLIAKYHTISAKEADTAIMLIQGLSNKEIATLTLTTVRNIEKHRLNLRKKMKIKKGEDLVRKIRQLAEGT